MDEKKDFNLVSSVIDLGYSEIAARVNAKVPESLYDLNDKVEKLLCGRLFELGYEYDIEAERDYTFKSINVVVDHLGVKRYYFDDDTPKGLLVMTIHPMKNSFLEPTPKSDGAYFEASVSLKIEIH